MGLYSMRLTFDGISLQNLSNDLASSSVSLIPFQTTYSYVTFFFVFWYQYFNASPSSCSGFVSFIGMIDDLVLSSAECNETARLNFTSSSAILTIIFAIPTVDSVIRFDAMFRPFWEVILSMAEITLA